MPVARLDAVELAPRRGARRPRSWARPTWTRLHAAGCADLANCDEVPVQPHVHARPEHLSGGAARDRRGGLTRIAGASSSVPVPGGRDDDPVHDARRPAVRAGRSAACTTATRRWPASAIRGCSAAGTLGWATACWSAARRRVAAARADRAEPVRARRRGHSPPAHPVRHRHVRSGGRLPTVARPSDQLQLAAYAQGQVSLYQNRTGSARRRRFFGGVQGSGRACSASSTGGLGADRALRRAPSAGTASSSRTATWGGPRSWPPGR